MTHKRAPVKSLVEIENEWTLDDLLDANIALDLWDELDAKAYRKARDTARGG